MKLERGLTLIEMLVTIALISLLLLGVFEIYYSFSKTYTKQNASMDVAISAARIVDEVNEMGLQARSVLASHTINGSAYSTGTSTLVLQLPAVSGSGDVVSNTYDYAVFYQSGTSAYVSMDADAASSRKDVTRTLTSVLGSLTFTYDNGDPSLSNSILVDVTTHSTTSQQSFDTHLTHTVYLRNK